MNDVNVVVVSGTVGRAPEVRTTPSGVDVGSVNIEVSENWTGKERKEFVRVVAFKDLAATVSALALGDRIIVQGRWSSRTWEDKNGNKQRTTEVVARSIDRISGGDPSAGGGDLPDDFAF